MLSISVVIVLAILYGVYVDKRDAKRKAVRICANCKHLLWLVGIGQGLRCGSTKSITKWPMKIPTLKHTCNHFEEKRKES